MTPDQRALANALMRRGYTEQKARELATGLRPPTPAVAAEIARIMAAR
jgi:hypothetical protein